jgi:asparagine synthetase B (glutamine-hydrolysing)
MCDTPTALIPAADHGVETLYEAVFQASAEGIRRASTDRRRLEAPSTCETRRSARQPSPVLLATGTLDTQSHDQTLRDSMCSFVFSSVAATDTAFNRAMRLRGPDATNERELGGYYFCHNLLSMRGDFVAQPHVSDDGAVLVLFNGEIYNCPETEASEAAYLSSLYREHGNTLFKLLDGEYSIVIVDFEKKRFLAARDCFGTKPLFFGHNGSDFALGSYRSALELLGMRGVRPLKPNTVVDYGLDGTSITTSEIITFNIAQYSDDLDGWHALFDKAVGKRIAHMKGAAFVGLSSGYDSGAIAASLIAQEAEFISVTVEGREDPAIVSARREAVQRSGNRAILLPQEKIDRSRWSQWLKENVEDEPYFIVNDAGEHVEIGKSIHKDKAALILAAVCDTAKEAGARVYLSGSGADEIYSDYGFRGKKIFAHSNFGGDFPENLLGKFPWASVFGSTQAAYLAKEEMVAGSFGMEARYPFLDVELVQHFLNLKPEIKNAVYKSTIKSYLEARSFPFSEGTKLGFGFAKTPGRWSFLRHRRNNRKNRVV